jgi:8-oxo-dGTP pyrophosphatase MutT (NUDIX family)
MATALAPTSKPPREVVAAVLTYRGAIGLFRRSARVSGDAGRWHCITGFLPGGANALGHALMEIDEETGIPPAALRLHRRTVLKLTGQDGRVWLVHAFHFESATDAVLLNWEHDACCWTEPDNMEGLGTVSWLGQVCGALLPTACGQLQEVKLEI